MSCDSDVVRRAPAFSDDVAPPVVSDVVRCAPAGDGFSYAADLKNGQIAAFGNALPIFYRVDRYSIWFDSRVYFNFDRLPLSAASAQITWAPAECTVHGVRKVHPETRVAFKCQEPTSFASPTLSAILTSNQLMTVGATDFLKYETGCFALKHVDKMGDYTCLFFPAGCQSTGGELLLHHHYDERTIAFKPYDIKVDTLVIFPTNMVHEVLPITSGQRYVFKIGLAAIPAEVLAAAKKTADDAAAALAAAAARKFSRKFSCNVD